MIKLWLTFMILIISITTLGQSEGILNKLLAPGPLMKGHAEFEKKDCLKCHEAGKGVSNTQCLDCHKPIKKFVDAKKSFHGLTQQTCTECHSDHKGRDYDSLAVDEKTFNHGQKTGYTLEGKHSELKCAECHKTKYTEKSIRAGKTRYFGAQASCVSCHKKDDKHQFKGEWAKKDCNSCHSLKSWKTEIKFDHFKDTGYKLEGKHAEMKCADCHGPNKTTKKITYKWTRLKQQQCLTCHADLHKNNLSKKFQNGQCLKCHSQTEWKIPKFNHQVTGYPLRGKHFEINCIECHDQKSLFGKKAAKSGTDKKSEVKKEIKLENKIDAKHFNFTGLKPACLSCHTDYHKFGKIKTEHFQDPNKCQNCHTETSWKKVTAFDHNKQTHFVIDGKHQEINCLGCHVENIVTKKPLPIGIYKWSQLKAKNCETCHQSPHLKSFSSALLKKQCTECHITSSWYDMKSGTSFDHSKTRLPLSGAHTQTKCADCHGKSGKQVFKFKSVDLKFCIDCHQNIHTNQFSKSLNIQNCSQCHRTENFKDRLNFDHSTTRYPLDESHNKIKCEECHKPSGQEIFLLKPNIHRLNKASLPDKFAFKLTQFKMPKVEKTECLACHTDYHNGQLGSQCLNCHSITEWKETKFEHNKQSRFQILGKHENVKCSECHKPLSNQFVSYKNKQRNVTLFKPLAAQCNTCHKDVHSGSFGKKCEECHTEKGWKITKDFHKNFTLTGVHYSLACNECHRGERKLSGMSNQCLTCHAKDDVHSGTLPQCQECHRQQFWEVAGFKHSLTQFPLRGAHRTLDCMECHKTGTYKGLSSQCASCHLQAAISTIKFNHVAEPNFMSRCTECHKNHFKW